MKRRVYFQELNVGMGDVSYLPLVSGLLRARAETIPEIKSNYEFMPFIYRMALPSEILANYTERPDVAAFSSVSWNEQLNYAVAWEVKRRWPDCLVIFGGPNVPMPPQDDVIKWMWEHRFIDLAVRSEGEDAFMDILLRYLEERDFRDIPDVACRGVDDDIVFCDKQRPFRRNLSELPSPYLEGLYNYLLDGRQWQAIIETNRGCNWPCTFCYWGAGGLKRKFKYHELERVFAEIDWMGRNGIKYLFNCLPGTTEISTPNGIKKLEAIQPDDTIIGQNDRGDIVESRVGGIVSYGRREIWRIDYGRGSVEATANHPLFTKRGWKTVDEINVGDELLYLQSVACGPKKSERDKENVLSAMRRNPCGEYSQAEWRRSTTNGGDTPGPDSGELQATCPNGTRQKNCERDGRESHSVVEKVSRRRAVRESSRIRTRRQELDEAYRSRGASGARAQGGCYEPQGGILLGKRRESSLQSDDRRAAFSDYRQLEKANAEVLGRPGMARRAFLEGRGPAERIRGGTTRVFPQAQFHLQVYGGQNVLAWAGDIGRVPEPGFYPRDEGYSESYLGARSVLAPKRGGGRSRAERLLLYGVERSDDLGRRSARREPGQENSRVSWVPVIAKEKVGRKVVYDLIDVSPTHNFFANGVLVSNSDSNFGQHPRDGQIADFIVETKKKYGFPDKFRTCYGKNSDDKIFKIGAMLHANSLEKGITLARQSNDPTTLENIRRQNIKMSTYIDLQKRFNDQNIPVYAELILGLPGETVESWKKGVDELLEAGTRNQIFIYPCIVLTNTEMAEKSYREKFKLETRTIKLTEIHGSERPPEWVDEYEELVVGTYSMSVDDWRRMFRFSYVMMLFHSLKLAYYVMIYLLDEYGIKMSTFLDFVSERKFKADAPLIRRELDFYDEVIDRLLNRGEQRGTLWPEYGDIYWDMEEISFLRLTQHAGKGWNIPFYNELIRIVLELLPPINRAELAKLEGAIHYQRSRIPSQSQLLHDAHRGFTTYDRNFPEYFAKRFSSQEVKLEKKPQSATFTYGNHGGDKKRFARETILWGRKSGTMLIPCEWKDA